MFSHVNEMAVVVTTILGLAIGSIWYSPLLFGSYWIRSAGLTSEDIERQRARLAKILCSGFIAQASFFFVLSYVLTQATSFGYSVVSVAGIILSVCSALFLSMIVWEGRSIAYFCIHIGYAATVIFGGSAVLHYWPW